VTPRVDWRSDRGQVAGVEAIPFGILIFVVGALLVANAWAVLDAKMAVTSASREAARTFVESTDRSSARALADAAAREAISSYGRNPDRLHLVGGEAPDALDRCNPVTFTASYVVRAVDLPLIGGFGDITVSASHTEVVDPFRDRGADAGEALCA
jgi:hypothetical protein